MSNSCTRKSEVVVASQDTVPVSPDDTDAHILKQRIALLERELALRDDRIRVLESDMRVSRETIRQMEKSATLAMKSSIMASNPLKEEDVDAEKQGEKKTKTKRRKHRSKKSSEATRNSSDISYDIIAQHFPDMKLSTVLRAEVIFQEADIDGNGLIDANGKFS